MNSFKAGKILIDDAELFNVITGSKTENPAPAINPVKIDKIIEKNTEFLWFLRISKPIFIPTILFFIVKHQIL